MTSVRNIAGDEHTAHAKTTDVNRIIGFQRQSCSKMRDQVVDQVARVIESLRRAACKIISLGFRRLSVVES